MFVCVWGVLLHPSLTLAGAATAMQRGCQHFTGSFKQAALPLSL